MDENFNTPGNFAAEQPLPAVAKGSYGLAVTSLVLGILSFVFSCCLFPLAILTSITGLVLGIIGVAKNSKRGIAIAGIILSAASLLMAIVVLMLVLLGSTLPWTDIITELESEFSRVLSGIVI